jgi:glycosyltransferase involved in cell wall biosynthesis
MGVATALSAVGQDQMKVLLLTRYTRKGASSRLRSLQYVDMLASLGVEVQVSPLLGDGYLQAIYTGQRKPLIALVRTYLRRLSTLLRARDFDLIWIEKELFPNLPSWFERLLAGTRTPYVVDYDDAIFHNYDQTSNPLKRLLKNKIAKVMRHSAMVIAGNSYLGDYAIRAGATVTIIPTVIDIRRYPEPVTQAPEAVLSVGWIGSPATIKFLITLLPVMERLAAKLPLQLVIIGASIDTQRYPFARNVAWSEQTEVEEISRFDVGVMPLPDAPWERGKCAYKLIQYMACGKAVVASPVGMNVDVVQHGVNGFLASSDEQWFQALSELLSNPQLRQSMGRVGRTLVEEQYCLQIAAPRLQSLFEQIISKRKSITCAA